MLTATSEQTAAPPRRQATRGIDEELIEEMRAGDESALARFYNRHAGLAFGLALKVLHDRESAEEVVQDAFVAVWRASRSYDPSMASPRTWLCTIVRNRATDHLRARRSRPVTAELAEAHAITSPDDVPGDVAANDERARVRASLRTLPAEQRRTIELAYFGSRSFSEVARMMNVSVGTAKSRARLAMRRLRRNAQLRIAYHGDQMRAVPAAVSVPVQEAS